ncbi:MAG: hypothetical protein M0C28_44060 [Candidatus Moduliflexus flocculans]|nr:hypothetical protein [Candidatus Moduliflexus flocculans]
MRSAVIIYNPAAGRYSVKPFIKSAVRELESAGWTVDAAETRSGAHTIELAKQASAEKKDAVFAVGGDGTIGNVVNGLIGTETALGVLPRERRTSGASNWDCSPFAWTHPWVLRKNASILANAPCHAVDVGTCNQYSFMMWAGIGLDALTIHSIEPRIRPGKVLRHARIHGEDHLAGRAMERRAIAAVGGRRGSGGELHRCRVHQHPSLSRRSFHAFARRLSR